MSDTTDTNEIRQPLPEVAAYFAAEDAAATAFSKAYEDAEDALTDAARSVDHRYSDPKYMAALSVRSEAIAAARAARATALDTAREALRDSGNELALHLVDEYLHNYQEETTILLKSLPLTLAEMDELALEQDWCVTYMTARLEMQQAGFLPLDDITPAMARLADNLLSSANLLLREYLDLLHDLRAVHAEGVSEGLHRAREAAEAATTV